MKKENYARLYYLTTYDRQRLYVKWRQSSSDLLRS